MSTETKPAIRSKLFTNIRKIPPWVLTLVGGVIVIGGWHYVIAYGVIQTFLFPTPGEVLSELIRIREALFEHLMVTLFEAIVGFVIATVLGVTMAILIVVNDRARRTLMPLIIGGNSVPRVALAPVIIFYLGGGSVAKYVIAAWLAFFPMLVNTVDGLELENEDRENMLDLFDANIWQEFRFIRFPTALPHMFDGMKLASSLAIVGAVVGEFVAATRGLGYLLLFALENFEYAMGFATVFSLGIVGVAVIVGLFLLQSRIVFWREATLYGGEL